MCNKKSILEKMEDKIIYLKRENEKVEQRIKSLFRG